MNKSWMPRSKYSALCEPFDEGRASAASIKTPSRIEYASSMRRYMNRFERRMEIISGESASLDIDAELYGGRVPPFNPSICNVVDRKPGRCEVEFKDNLCCSTVDRSVVYFRATLNGFRVL